MIRFIRLGQDIYYRKREFHMLAFDWDAPADFHHLYHRLMFHLFDVLYWFCVLNACYKEGLY